MSDTLVLKFDPNTIEHLGVSLYSKLPSVLSELVSNSWDADADEVSINFLEGEDGKEIIYKDDGVGMSFDELQKKYLVIGRNRRRATNNQITPKGRKVIGKKGLGKLSVFGVCDVIEVISVKDGLKNHFLMDLVEIRQSQETSYSPQIISKDQETTEGSRTELVLKKIRRKSSFDLGKIALSLSKKFLIFDRMPTVLFLNEGQKTDVTNDLKFKELNVEFEWKFPNKEYDSNYEHWKDVHGTIFTLKTPVKDTEMRGIYLTSRGKIVNTAEFYGARDNDQFHSYVTGYLEVDFIDNFDEDVISTDRHSLNWEHEKTRDLQAYIQRIIRKMGGQWKKKRAAAKKQNIKVNSELDIEKWQQNLPTYEKELSQKIIDPILENSNIDVPESTEIIGNVIDKFDNKVFKDYASKIADISEPEQIPQLLKLMEEWKAIEAKEIKGLADARIEVIKQFEYYLDTDTREVPTLHNFLKKFSWLLDPRILEFRDEVTYSKLLKDSFPEDGLDEKDRRIDFLCSNALGEILYVIEIKRSQYRVDAKALEQAYDYGSFLKGKYATQTGFSKVVCYVVGGTKSSERRFTDKERTYMQTGEVFVKTYRELLEQSKEYHREFLKVHDKYNKA
jgi:hypothetical protein